MPLIEKIRQMQKQGLKDVEIAQRLKEEGITPREISEALDQNRIKSAVFTNEKDMEQSIMKPEPDKNVLIYPPQETMPEQMPEMQEAQGIEGGYGEEVVPEYQSYQQTPQQPPEYQYEEYQYPQPQNTEIITEIAQQIIEEKTESLEKEISEISKFKTEAQGKINNIEERLKRIEIIIDRLQLSILKEIGNYGKNISEIKEEMRATQESFSKILEPLTENIKELRRITASAQTPKKLKK